MDLTYCSDEAAVSWANGVFANTPNVVIYGDDWFYMYGDTYKGIRQCNTFIKQSETAAIEQSEKNLLWQRLVSFVLFITLTW